MRVERTTVSTAGARVPNSRNRGSLGERNHGPPDFRSRDSRGHEVGATSGTRARTKAGLAVADGASLANRQKQVQRPRPTLPLQRKTSHEVLAAAVGAKTSQATSVAQHAYSGGARIVVRHLLCLRQEHLGCHPDFAVADLDEEPMPAFRALSRSECDRRQ
jgi:hypothetical protein